MRIGKVIKIDFSSVKTLDDYYNMLADKFGFPDFFGRNGNALIDCLTYLREPEAGMTNIHVSKDAYLLLELSHLSGLEKDIKDAFLTVLEYVSLRYRELNEEPPIVLLLKQ